MPLDLTDPKTVKKLEAAARDRENMDGITLTHLMDTQSGREYIWRKLENSRIFGSIFNDSPLRMAFNEGRRDVGLVLFNEVLKHCPEQYVLMTREANERSAANERALDSNGDGSNQGPDERQLDLYRDVTGVTIEYGPDEPASPETGG